MGIPGFASIFKRSRPVEFVSGAAGEVGLAMPAHQAGDLIVLCANEENDGFTAPPAEITPPAGWNTIGNRSQVGSNTSTHCGTRATLFTKIATSNVETLAGFPATMQPTVVIYRHAKIGAFAFASAISGTPNTYPALTLQRKKSRIVAFFLSPAAVLSLSSLPGFTTLASYDTHMRQRAYTPDAGEVDTFTGASQTNGGGSPWITASVEIKRK